MRYVASPFMWRDARSRPWLLGSEAEVRHIDPPTALAYRDARKDISALSVCHLGVRLGTGSGPVTAQVSRAFAFISRSSA